MSSRIRDVWAPNLDSEMRLIRSLVDRYPYVAMVRARPPIPHTHPTHALPQDTEFPGVVARPIPNSAWRTSSDYHYQTMRCNVDLLKLIQIGITIADEDGNFPDETTTWQFNFHFDLKSVRPARSRSSECALIVLAAVRTSTHQSPSSSSKRPASTLRGTRK
jgi:CCR4-NOT transcription complex subunit 7/8